MSRRNTLAVAIANVCPSSDMHPAKAQLAAAKDWETFEIGSQQRRLNPQPRIQMDVVRPNGGSDVSRLP